MPSVVGVNVSASSYGEVVQKCSQWARNCESRTVLFVGTHGIMEAHDNPVFRAAMNTADLANPDGMPVVWALRAFGAPHASRVYGPDTTVALLRAAEQSGIPIGFYGGDDAALAMLVHEIECLCPLIKIAFTMSSPDRKLTEEEDEAIVDQIKRSGVRWLFIGLGCPKQENWVFDHKGRIPAVLLAVGTALDFIAGTRPQAPGWMMRNGLDWAFLLASEPRRLAARYFKNLPRFTVLVVRQWLTRNTSQMAKAG